MQQHSPYLQGGLVVLDDGAGDKAEGAGAAAGLQSVESVLPATDVFPAVHFVHCPAFK